MNQCLLVLLTCLLGSFFGYSDTTIAIKQTGETSEQVPAPTPPATTSTPIKSDCTIKLVDREKVPISMETVRFVEPKADSFYNFKPGHGIPPHEFRGPASTYELEWHCLRLKAATKSGASYGLGQDGLYLNNTTEVAKWKTRNPDEAVVILVDDLKSQTVAFTSPPADRFYNFSAGSDPFQSPAGVFHGSPGEYSWSWEGKSLTGRVESGKWYGLGRDGLYLSNRSAVAKWNGTPFPYTKVGNCLNQWTDYPNRSMKHGCEICALAIALSEQGVEIDARELWAKHVRPTGEYRQSPAQGGACEAICLKHAVDGMQKSGYYITATNTKGSTPFLDLQKYRDRGSSVVFFATCGPDRSSTFPAFNRRNMHALTLVRCTPLEVRYKDTWVGEERTTSDVARVTAAYNGMGRQAVIISRTEVPKISLTYLLITPLPDRIVANARKHIGSGKWAFYTDRCSDVGHFGMFEPKCNLFVAEVLYDSGYRVPLSATLKPSTRALIVTSALYDAEPVPGAIIPNEHGFISSVQHLKSLYRPRPPVAKEWFKGLVGRGVTMPFPGDIVTDGKHVGIVTSVGTTVSASSKPEDHFLVVENDWAFRPGQDPVKFFRISEK